MFKAVFLAVTIVAQGQGYYTSLANHISRWLRGENIASSVVQVSAMKQALQGERIAFLVGFENPTAADMSTLRSFCSKGGKLVVFHSASSALGELMGVKPVGFKAASYPGEWSRMNFSAKQPQGLPISILQTSTVLQRAVPVLGKGRVIATWADRSGRSSGEPAWIATANGYWMTHVLLADGDEDLKARLCASMVGSVEPYKWNFAAHLKRKAAQEKAMREYASVQTPRAAEIHAVWDHSGAGLYPGDWPRTIAILKRSHVTDLFVNVAGAGFAHYPSSILPRSKLCQTEGDQLAKCLAAAKGSGIRVHAWILCFNATRATPECLENFRKKGWCLKSQQGKLTEYLSPANPGVRSYVLSAITEIQSRYAVSGIHLDFIRWGDGTVKTKDAAVQVSQFVSEARRAVKRPKWLTTAVYGKYPACIGSVGQDWDCWLRMNLVDYVVPMDYTESSATFTELLAQHAMSRYHARKTIVGIGVTANESRLDARKVIEQINLSRRYGMAGNSLFDLDTTLEKNILPYLALGIW